MSRGPQSVRYAEIERETRSTRVQVVLDLDGGVRQDIATGFKQLDWWIEAMAKHGAINLGIKAELESGIDERYLMDDMGNAIGQAVRDALRNSEPVVRFSSNQTPCGDALVAVALDLMRGGTCQFEVPFDREAIAGIATQSIGSLFKAVANHGGMTLHVRKLAGTNDLDVCEAAFIGFGRALGDASRIAEKSNGSK